MVAANGGRNEKGGAAYGGDIDHDAPMFTVAAVRVLRWLWIHDKSFRERTSKRLETVVPSVSAERVMKSLIFLYLTIESEDDDYCSSVFNVSIPEMLGDVLSSNKLEKRKSSSTAPWEETLFWGLLQTSIDPYMWDSHPFVQDKIKALGKNSGSPKQVDKIRHEYARRKFSSHLLFVKEHVSVIVEMALKITNHMCIDRAINCNVNRFRDELADSWSVFQPIQSMFYCHSEITQPVLLAALLYSGITRPRNGETTIRNSQQLKARYPALHRLFYIILECAQASTTVVQKAKNKKLRPMESCDVYSVDPAAENTSKSASKPSTTATPNTGVNSTSKSTSTKPSSIGSSPLPSEVGTFDGPPQFALRTKTPS
jgi:hypothetical protein